MTTIKDLLSDLETIDQEKYEIISTLRNDLLASHPEITEEIKYGGILFSINNQPFGGLFVSKNHVSVEFSDGYKLSDPNNLLEGTGKFRRHLKLSTLSDIASKQASQFMELAIVNGRD
jgi:hypothetical protein